MVAMVSLAKQDNTDSQMDPLVTVKPSPGYKLGKYVFFPLRLPSYIVKGLTLPLSALSRASEKHHLIQRTIDLFRDEDRKFFIYPLISAGFGSGFGGGAAVEVNNVFAKGFSLKTSAMVFIDLDSRANLTLSGRPHYIGNLPFRIFISANWRQEKDDNIFAIGNDSAENSSSNFSSKDFSSGVGFDLGLGFNFKLIPQALFEYSSTSSSSNSPKVENVLSSAQLDGFNQSTCFFLFVCFCFFLLLASSLVRFIFLKIYRPLPM